MTITLYNNSAEPSRVDKTPYLSGGTVMTKGVRLMEHCSIDAPTLIIAASERPAFNYCYIQEFSRYYFAKPAVWLGNNCWSIYCEEDYVMSIKAQLLTKKGLFSRAADVGKFNMIIDTKVVAEQSTIDDISYQDAIVDPELDDQMHPKYRGFDIQSSATLSDHIIYSTMTTPKDITYILDAVLTESNSQDGTYTPIIITPEFNPLIDPPEFTGHLAKSFLRIGFRAHGSLSESTKLYANGSEVQTQRQSVGAGIYEYTATLSTSSETTFPLVIEIVHTKGDITKSYLFTLTGG